MRPEGPRPQRGRMSLAHSHKDLRTEDASVKVRLRPTEPRPRALQRPDSFKDEVTVSDPKHPPARPFTKPNGNYKPQEPLFLGPRMRGLPQRTVGKLHAKSWSSSIQPGHQENAAASSPYHRTWMSDSALADKVPKWNSSRLEQHFREQDKALFALKPHDEIHAVRANMKYWTHLLEEGMQAGGQEKLDLVPERGTGKHLKGGLYSGKFENIKHAQLMFRTHPKQDWVKDKRPAFDNRLMDDMIRYDDGLTREAAASSFDLYRPANTMSCPRLGGEFVNR